jgi:hypothetical protein
MRLSESMKSARPSQRISAPLALSSSGQFLDVVNRESFGDSIAIYSLGGDGSLPTGSNGPPNVHPVTIMSHDLGNKLGAPVALLFAHLP